MTTHFTMTDTPWPLLIGGEAVAAESGQTFEAMNPSTGAVLARDTAGLSFAGLTAERLAHDVLDPVLRDLFGEAPHWRGMGALLTGALQTRRLLLRFECETALVDPLFGGDALRGGALILQTAPQHAPLH